MIVIIKTSPQNSADCFYSGIGSGFYSGSGFGSYSGIGSGFYSDSDSGTDCSFCLKIAFPSCFTPCYQLFCNE